MASGEDGGAVNGHWWVLGYKYVVMVGERGPTRVRFAVNFEDEQELF